MPTTKTEFENMVTQVIAIRPRVLMTIQELIDSQGWKDDSWPDIQTFVEAFNKMWPNKAITQDDLIPKVFDLDEGEATEFVKSGKAELKEVVRLPLHERMRVTKKPNRTQRKVIEAFNVATKIYNKELPIVCMFEGEGGISAPALRQAQSLRAGVWNRIHPELRDTVQMAVVRVTMDNSVVVLVIVNKDTNRSEIEDMAFKHLAEISS